LTSALRFGQIVVFAALGLVCLRIWRRQRGAAGAWLAVTFGDLAAVSLVELALPQRLAHALGPTAAEHWVLKVVLLAIFVFPYPLFRFVAELEPAPARRRRLALVLTVAVAAWSLALPRILASADHRRPWWIVVLLILLVAEWATLASMVAVQLWKAGRHQPNGVRRRMQLLAGAALLLIAVLAPAASTSNADTTSGAHLASGLIGLTTAVLFYLGFAPPAILRATWRRREERALVRAEMALMSVYSPDDVARSILPAVAAIFAARRCALVDPDGAPMGVHGMAAADLEDWVGALRSVPGEAGLSSIKPGVVAFGLRHGRLVMETGSYTPLFGEDELGLLSTLGAFIDLAMERAELSAKERDTREELERAHAELESLVHTFSHDLKSPLISLVGYLDFLRSDYGDRLDETGLHYLDRMGASATYMSELIHDLLELSRIGRTDTEPEDVALEPLLRDVAEAMHSAYPAARVEIGALPTVRVNGLRARQLFTNLCENAARHCGRRDAVINVMCRPSEGGAVTIVVSDNGKGVPPEHRERVFGIFERLDPPGSASGTGMGLAICRKIVGQVHGRISIGDDGDGPGGGATFLIELPAALLRPRPALSRR